MSKIYEETRVYDVATLPRYGTSVPGYLRIKRDRVGSAHPKPFPPYPKRNNYASTDIRVTKVGYLGSGPTRFSFVNGADVGMVLIAIPQSFRNAVYEKFKSEVQGETSSLGIAFAQWKQSWGMVANRAYQLAKAAKSLYRGRFREFLDVLGIRPKARHKRKKRARASQAASLWLEYSFGWKPLAGDIYNAFLQLEEPIPVDDFAAAKMTVLESEVAHIYTVTRVMLSQSATISLSNPNLYLANQLGLVNIGEVVFDGVPFSFVLDWFTDCQLWISSFSDWVGLRVDYPATSLQRLILEETWVLGPGKIRLGTPCVRKGSMFHRSEGMIKPLPNFDVMANLGKSIPRGANAMSLLTQILAKF